MAVGHRLPNGYVCVLMTPREATLLADSLLDPEGFPWMNPTESQMVALEFKQICKEAVVMDSMQKLNTASNELINVLQAAEAEKQKKAKGFWQCECGYINGREHESCQNCGVEKQAVEAIEEE